MKTNNSKPRWLASRKKRRHFKLGFEFSLARERKEEFETFLREANLIDHSLMRLDYKRGYPGLYKRPDDVMISFQHLKHAMWFKLAWVVCEPSELHPFTRLNKVILPVIRRVMPKIIAQNIIGVSPMTGPHPSIYSMRARYAEDLASAPDPQSLGMPNSLAETKRDGAPLGSS